MEHIMIDCETLGLLPGSAIISIGAVAFDPKTLNEFGPRFYRNITRISNIECSLKVDANTLKWWGLQSEEAKKVLQVNQIHLDQALTEFGQWWKDIGAVTFWSHGLNFDEPLLRVAFSEVGLDAPWNYRQVRDTRTLFWLAGFDEKSVVIPGAVEHNALDDATRQALAVQMAYAQLYCNGVSKS